MPGTTVSPSLGPADVTAMPELISVLRMTCPENSLASRAAICYRTPLTFLMLSFATASQVPRSHAAKVPHGRWTACPHKYHGLLKAKRSDLFLAKAQKIQSIDTSLQWMTQKITILGRVLALSQRLLAGNNTARYLARPLQHGIFTGSVLLLLLPICGCIASAIWYFFLTSYADFKALILESTPSSSPILGSSITLASKVPGLVL